MMQGKNEINKIPPSPPPTPNPNRNPHTNHTHKIIINLSSYPRTEQWESRANPIRSEARRNPEIGTKRRTDQPTLAERRRSRTEPQNAEEWEKDLMDRIEGDKVEKGKERRRRGLRCKYSVGLVGENRNEGFLFCPSPPRFLLARPLPILT